MMFLSMRFELEILDGNKKGHRLALTNGLVLGNANGEIGLIDSEMAGHHAVASLDSKNAWNIECLAPNMLRLGFEEVQRATLIMGLIFHLGQTGFKVVAREKSSLGPWKEALKSWLDLQSAQPTQSHIVFFLKPLRLKFVQGPQYNEVYTLSYGPRLIGYNHFDIRLTDPASPTSAIRFYQVVDQIYIENLCGDKALLNGMPFDQISVKDGDLLKITTSVIELSFIS
jgi:hypothetical protein